MTLTPEQFQEIAESQATHYPSRRAASPGMEAILYQPFACLDHGFVRAVDYMGNDQAICQAARVSYGKGTKATSDDRGLIRYLMRHHHSTPFEMCEIKLHVKLPVFVARQWIRHRMANVNEYSARYSILDREFYVPAPQDIAMQSATNNQGRGLPIDHPESIIQDIEDHNTASYDLYQELIREIDEDGYGVAREIGRMVLPANIYTQWYWKTDLHNLFNFIRLRNDPHAQFEIRCYAQGIADIVASWVPLAFEAFKDYRQNAVSFSAQELEILKSLLSDTSVKELDLSEDGQGLSKREATEFLTKIRG